MICKTCHTDKPAESFHRRGRDTEVREGSCKACRHAKQMKVREGKHPARMELTRAIERGILVPPDICERCGREGRVEGHHADYARPLDVEWLCRSCHRLHHEGEKRAAA